MPIVLTRKHLAAGTIMQGPPRRPHAQAKLQHRVSQAASNQQGENPLTMAIPNNTIDEFKTVKTVCRFDENSLPLTLLCHSHSSGGKASVRVRPTGPVHIVAGKRKFHKNLQLNQLPKSAPIKPSSKLKFGIASAKTQLASHAPEQIPHQLPRLLQLLVCTSFVPFHTLR